MGARRAACGTYNFSGFGQRSAGLDRARASSWHSTCSTTPLTTSPLNNIRRRSGGGRSGACGAFGGVRGMDNGLVAILLMAGDAEFGDRISLVHTVDLVWFLARSAFIIAWMDTDRADREDTTVVLPFYRCVWRSSRWRQTASL